MGVSSYKLREKKLKMAVYSAFISKFFSFFLQVLSVPLAIKALGVEKYAAFVVITASLAWISMISLGSGPGLTRGLAISVSSADQDGEKKYFAGALFSVLAIIFILLLTIIFLDVFGFVDVLELVNNQKFPNEYKLLFFLIILNIFFGLAEGARAGYQEQHFTHIFASVSSVSTVIFLCFVVFYPSIIGLILAIYGTATAFRCFNFIYLLLQRTYLLTSFSFLDFKTTKIVAFTGFAFFLVQLSSFLVQQGVLLVMALFSTKSDLVAFSLFIKIIIMFGAVVLIITQSFWPAITDAYESKEYAWIIKEYKKKLILVSFYAFIVSLMIFLCGGMIIDYWGTNELEYDKTYHYFFGPYFFFAIWSHYHYMVLVGLGVIWSSAIILLIEGIVIIGLSYLLAKSNGSHVLPLVMLVITISISSLFLPCIFIKKINKLLADENKKVAV